MSFLKLSINTSMFLFSALFVLFSSCEKNEIMVTDPTVASLEILNNKQAANSTAYLVSSSTPSDETALEETALVYLEIPEEYLAGPDQEVVLQIENGPFYTEEGEEVAGSIMWETTVEGGTFFTIGVSQNLLDMGVINSDLYAHSKPWIDYYLECVEEGNCGNPTATNLCTFLCKVSATSDYLLQN